MQTSVPFDMLICVRTTLNLPDGLIDAAKRLARAEGRSLTSLIEDGLRAVLARADAASSVPVLPAYGQREAPMLIDLDDRDALWAALDAADET